MTLRGRPRNVEPSTNLKIWLPESLVAAIRLLHYDPLRGKTEHGAISAYFETLVRADLARRAEENKR